MPITFKKRIPLDEAVREAGALSRALISAGMKRVEVCGSVRRRKETVGDLDLVVEGDLGLVRDLSGYPLWNWKEGAASKATLEWKGLQVNLLASDEEHWGAAIFYFTGPHDYNIAYRRKAKRMGLLLNEKGLFLNDPGPGRGKCIACRTEADIYRALGKEWKAPELRGK